MNLKSQHCSHRSIQVAINNQKKTKFNNKNQIDQQKEISSEFIIRQKEYEDLYRFPNYQSENLVNIKDRREYHQSKFKTIINDAKQRFINTYSQSNKNYLEKQQISMKLIVEQLRNQKRVQNKGNLNQIKNTRQINLNLILSLSIPILCFIVVFIELFKQDLIIV